MKLSRVRVAFQILVHVALVAHVLAYYFLDWKIIGALDFQSFFHHFLGKGLLTAGALLAIVVYGTALVFGRLFCSWGCHFGATQDLAAWLLRRLGWKPPLVRTRFLHHVPFALLIVVFLLPIFQRWRSDGFVLENPDLAAVAPWDTLPGWMGTIVTFGVCGAGVLLFLGTRGFCRFVCPYGAVFRLTDFASFFRVRRVAHCTSDCANQAVHPCTAACPTAIDVHLETSQRGVVTSVDCVRCNLCVEACPSQALAHVTRSTARRRLALAQVGAPEPGSSFRPIGLPLRLRGAPTVITGSLPERPFARTFDLGPWGELLVVLVGVVTYLCVDLVHGGHFLAASVALAEGMLVYIVLGSLRTDSRMSIVGRRLRSGKSWTFVGITTLGFLALTLVPIFEAGVFKWLRWSGLRLDPNTSTGEWAPPQGAMILRGSMEGSRLAEAADRYRRALEYFPTDLATRKLLMSAYARLGDPRALKEAQLIASQSPDLASLRLLEWARERFGQGK